MANFISDWPGWVMFISGVIFTELSSFFYFYCHGNNKRFDKFNAAIKLRVKDFLLSCLEKIAIFTPCLTYSARGKDSVFVRYLV